MSELEKEINRIVDERVEKALEEKLPAIIRALGLKEAEPEQDGLVGAVEVAKFLKRDLSSPANILKAKKHVYHLAQIGSIPCVRISERNLRFDMAEVKKALAAKATSAAA